MLARARSFFATLVFVLALSTSEAHGQRSGPGNVPVITSSTAIMKRAFSRINGSVPGSQLDAALTTSLPPYEDSGSGCYVLAAVTESALLSSWIVPYEASGKIGSPKLVEYHGPGGTEGTYSLAFAFNMNLFMPSVTPLAILAQSPLNLMVVLPAGLVGLSINTATNSYGNTIEKYSVVPANGQIVAVSRVPTVRRVGLLWAETTQPITETTPMNFTLFNYTLLWPSYSSGIPAPAGARLTDKSCNSVACVLFDSSSGEAMFINALDGVTVRRKVIPQLIGASATAVTVDATHPDGLVTLSTWRYVAVLRVQDEGLSFTVEVVTVDTLGSPSRMISSLSFITANTLFIATEHSDRPAIRGQLESYRLDGSVLTKTGNVTLPCGAVVTSMRLVNLTSPSGTPRYNLLTTQLPSSQTVCTIAGATVYAVGRGSSGSFVVGQALWDTAQLSPSTDSPLTMITDLPTSVATPAMATTSVIASIGQRESGAASVTYVRADNGDALMEVQLPSPITLNVSNPAPVPMILEQPVLSTLPTVGVVTVSAATPSNGPGLLLLDMNKAPSVTFYDEFQQFSGSFVDNRNGDTYVLYGSQDNVNSTVVLPNGAKVPINDLGFTYGSMVYLSQGVQTLLISGQASTPSTAAGETETAIVLIDTAEAQITFTKKWSNNPSLLYFGTNYFAVMQSNTPGTLDIYTYSDGGSLTHVAPAVSTVLGNPTDVSYSILDATDTELLMSGTAYGIFGTNTIARVGIQQGELTQVMQSSQVSPNTAVVINETAVATCDAANVMLWVEGEVSLPAASVSVDCGDMIEVRGHVYTWTSNASANFDWYTYGIARADFDAGLPAVMWLPNRTFPIAPAGVPTKSLVKQANEQILVVNVATNPKIASDYVEPYVTALDLIKGEPMWLHKNTVGVSSTGIATPAASAFSQPGAENLLFTQFNYPTGKYNGIEAINVFTGSVEWSLPSVDHFNNAFTVVAPVAQETNPSVVASVHGIAAWYKSTSLRSMSAPKGFRSGDEPVFPGPTPIPTTFAPGPTGGLGAPSTSSGLSTGEKAGIAVAAVVVVGGGIAVVAVFALQHSRRRRSAAQTYTPVPDDQGGRTLV